MLATDALIANGGELSEISTETMEALNGILAPAWSHNNPIDVLGDASPERYAKAVEIAAKDPNSDGLLVILTPQAMTDPDADRGALEAVCKAGRQADFGELDGRRGGSGGRGNSEPGEHSDLPVSGYRGARVHLHVALGIQPERPLRDAVAARNIRDGAPDKALTDEIIQNARRAGRTILTEAESKQVLDAYGIPTVRTWWQPPSKKPSAHAEQIGYPVVLKLFSETITHKTDVGGVQLNLGDREAVERAWNRIQASVTEKVGAEHFQGVTVQPMIKSGDGYELIIGSSLDSQFGPVLLFGTGGQLVEVFKDRALSLPPLNTTLARRMMEQTKIYQRSKACAAASR